MLVDEKYIRVQADSRDPPPSKGRPAPKEGGGGLAPRTTPSIVGRRDQINLVLFPDGCVYELVQVQLRKPVVKFK